jgi:hypothetical protein
MYQHPDDINLRNLHKSMEYGIDGKPLIRTSPVITDSAANTSFGRLRTAGTKLLGEFRTQYGTTDVVEILTHFENNGSQTVNLSQSHVLINVTNDSGSRAVRQSRKYHHYTPGTTNLGFISFTLGLIQSNVQQMIGMFDDSNGIFFRMNGTQPEMVIRRAGTDTEIGPQSLWNLDKFDGTGPSGITLDFTKSQILVIDYQWLGVGRVRTGFSVGGITYYVHEFSHINALSGPYLLQPSLPVRWEIKNTSGTTVGSSLMCICYGIYIEGNDLETGFDHSVSNGTSSVTLGSGADAVKGILAIRLKNSVNGANNRITARLKDWEVVTNLTANYRVMILQNQADISGTPVWNDATPTSACEYTTNFSLAAPPTPANSIILFDGYAVGGSNRGVATSATTDNKSSSIYQNFDSTDSMIIAIVAYRIPNDNAVMRASLNWIEIR